MTIWLGGCSIAGAVTVITAASRAGIVHPGAANEGRGGVAEMAIQGCCKVAVILTGRGRPVTG